MNFVTERDDGVAGAVLIRAAEPWRRRPGTARGL